jgi:iron(III) transport system ATP-binding protein
MLRVAHLSKIFENQTDRIVGGIRDASFALEAGSFFALLGPSGCGKTTTLRCIAGLEAPDTGTIEVGSRRLFDADARVNVPVEQRAVGMVFQSYAIWPHMTVAENVAFPLTVARNPRHSRAEIAEAVRRALGVVDLDGFQERSATRLSGGQQQRVALARAIVHEPRLLLLDEPLSNLDAQLRDEMRSELKRLQHKIGITTVYVTHDQSEALALSDRLAVIDHGEIIQIGSPHDIYFRPANPFVARFVGATNLLPGRLTDRSGGRGRAEVLDGRAIECAVPQPIADATAISVSIRPESIRLKRQQDGAPPAGDNWLPGRISGVTFLGAAHRIDVVCDEVTLQVSAPSDLPLPSDPDVWLVFAPDAAVALPGREGE